MRTKDKPATAERPPQTGMSAHPLLADDVDTHGDLPAVSTDGALPPAAPRPSGPGTGRAGAPRLSALQTAAAALIVAGLVALVVGWVGASQKVEVWEQIPYLISGGIGGAALIGLGIAVYLAHEHSEDRRQRDLLAVRIERLEAELQAEMNWRLDELEVALAAEFDGLAARVTRADRGRE